uniref:OCIA domain containing 2 n=1 Tax=Scophthalmus maximus TaxID=52904 RepID=A0A8D3ASD5_SCOMX
MSSETTGQTIVKTEDAAAVGTNPAAVKEQRKCPLGDRHIHRDDVRKIWKECHEESFWYRGNSPLLSGSMAVTGGLIYNGIWKSSKRLGPFPKLAVAGILGYAVGTASYVGTCRSKFQADGSGFGPWSQGGFSGPFSKSGRGHRSGHHVCEECKKTAQAAPLEVKS